MVTITMVIKQKVIGYMYLTLTLLHSKNHGHVQAHFAWEYLINGDRQSKQYYCHLVESHAQTFDWYIYISYLTYIKRQDQTEAHFDCEYLVNGDRLCTH